MTNLVDMTGVTIKETRHLVLPLQTVLDAVVHYDRRNHGALLNGEPLQAEFVRGKPQDEGLAVAVRSTNDDTIEWRHLNTDELARAIISYCQSRRIPLPFAAEKTLSITEQGAALAIENTVNLAGRVTIEKDISGQPLRYARGYEPHAIVPTSKSEVCV
ncbi:MAG TPA: hypothetical protein VM146_02235 [Steroidobacteraceae bacterium]|nr:hypothetical protein [Steroidobacteraceae bacterium]